MSLIEIIDPAFLKSKLDYLDLSITGLRDALKGTGNKDFTTLETDVESILGKLDVNLSTRASETTLSAIKSQTDKLTFDASNRLAIQNPPNLDVALSTRLAESTFTGRWDGGIYGFDGTTARRIRTDSSGNLQINVLSTANPPNLDVALSTRLSEATFTGRFPSATALGDNISNPTTTIIGGALLGWDSGASAWERVNTDGSNRLKVQLDSIPNPSNLDVALSTRLSESTFTGRFPSGASLSDSLSNPTTTLIGSCELGFDGTNWRRLTALNKDISGGSRNALTVIASLCHDITRMPYMVENINVTTTESSTSISAPGGKIIKITNKGDVDVLIGINASVPATNPLKIRPRTIRIFMFGGATAIYYKTASGTSTIDIEYWN